MKKVTNRLLVILLCLALGLTITYTYTEDVHAETTADNENDQTADENEEEQELTLQQIKRSAIREIKDYAQIIKVNATDDVQKEIDKMVKQYVSVIGTATDDKNEEGLASESGISECVSAAKAAIDAMCAEDSGNTETEGVESDAPTTTSEFIMVGGNWVTPVATYGQVVNVVLPVVNMSAGNLTNVAVTPVTSNLVGEWPFEIETSGYTQTISDLPGKGNGQSDMDRRRELTWTLKTRSDALSGYYKLQFDVLYYVGTDVQTATLTTYVLVKGAPGSGNIEAEGGTSTPRVIITGFDTEPKDVHAGDTFVLTLHLKNTSHRTAVSNMLVNLTAPSEGLDSESTYAAFLPTSGSNTEYISKIDKGATTDLSIEMTAKADLSQKPYQIDVSMEYEDDNYSSYSSTADVSIPILQEARFELSTPEILPTSIMVGNESNIMFSIYNTGKLTLYNVKVRFEDDTVSEGEVFLGKIEAGGTGAVDALVMGTAPSVDDDIVKLVVEYEDEAGNKSTYEQEINITVTEDVTMTDMGMTDEYGMYEDGMGDVEYEDGSNKTPVIITLVVISLAIVITVVVLLVRKAKKKKEEEERINLLDEFEGEDDSDEIS